MVHSVSAMRVIAGSMVLLALALPESQAELITNGDFEIPGTNGLDTFTDGQSPNTTDSRTGAASWFIWHNQDGSTETNSLTYAEAGLPTIFPSQDPLTDRLLRVEASHAFNGLVQTWGSLGSGPDRATGSVWIYTGPGQIAGVGIGNGGNTQLSSETSGVGGRWEQISFTESTSPVNEINIYAKTSGALFYVDKASVHAVPEPASAGLLTASVFGLALSKRRRVR